MADERLSAPGNIRADWYLPNAFADWEAATDVELNAGINATRAISWNDSDFSNQASNTIDDPSWADEANTQTRGASQYGGSLSFYEPKFFNDPTNSLSVVKDAMSYRTVGYVVIRIDGAHSYLDPYVPGQLYSIYRVMTSSKSHQITGEEAFRYTIGMLSQGQIQVHGMVQGAGDPTIAITPGTAPTLTVGAKAALTATLTAADGDDDALPARLWTRGLTWTSSNGANVSVSANAVVTRNAAGAATITATHEPTGATATLVFPAA